MARRLHHDPSSGGVLADVTCLRAEWPFDGGWPSRMDPGPPAQAIFHFKRK